MTNSLALSLGLAIIALVGLDLVLFGGDNLLFLARKFWALLHWVAFWR